MPGQDKDISRELRRLRRADLLELLVAQAQEIESLNDQLDLAKRALQDRRVTIAECGTLAEASLVLNRVFQAADDAVRQYRENAIAQIDAEAESGAQAEYVELLMQVAQAKADLVLTQEKLEKAQADLERATREYEALEARRGDAS